MGSESSPTSSSSRCPAPDTCPTTLASDHFVERSYVCAVLLWGQSWLKGPSAGWQAAAGTVVRIANRANCEAPKSRRFTPNREALKTIPNCPNRYLMTPAVQWELKIVGDGFKPSLVHNFFGHEKTRMARNCSCGPIQQPASGRPRSESM